MTPKSKNTIQNVLTSENVSVCPLNQRRFWSLFQHYSFPFYSLLFFKAFFSLSLFILTKNEKKRNKNWSIVYYNSSPQGNILSGDSRRDIFVISFFQIVSSILPAKVTDDPQKRRVSCRKSFLGCLFGGTWVWSPHQTHHKITLLFQKCIRCSCNDALKFASAQNCRGDCLSWIRNLMSQHKCISRSAPF